jgi:hypothetical protein
MPSETKRVSLAMARAHWHRRQGLSLAQAGKPAEVVAKTGWLRTLGGADVYIAARARMPKLTRRTLDAAVEAMELAVMPAVRGCIYLVPRMHAATALRFAESMWRERAERDIEKAGSRWREVERVADGVRSVIGTRGLTTDALRKALPDGFVKSFGDRGKKVGLSSPLPVALRELEFRGEVERTLDEGRLDTERYLWRGAKRDPFRGAKLPSDPHDLAAMLGEIFFSQMAPATAKDFAEWSGLSQREAKDALTRVPLVEVDVEGYAEDSLVLTSDLAELEGKLRQNEAVRFLSFEDNYLTIHGGPAKLTDPSKHGLKVEVWGRTRGATLGDVKHLATRTLLVGDSLAGFWEYDPDASQVIWATFEPVTGKVRDEIVEAADELGRFLREEIGHARSFSLDTEDAMRERAEIVRSLQGGGPVKKLAARSGRRASR